MNKVRELDEKWHSAQTDLEKEKRKNAKLETDLEQKKSTQSKVRNKLCVLSMVHHLVVA